MGFTPGDGTFRADDPEQLLELQEPALKVVLDKFLEISREALKRHGKDCERQPKIDPDDVERPHHVFCIDGARGSGKTYTLLSTELALRQLSEVCRGGEVMPGWRDFLGKCVKRERLEEFSQHVQKERTGIKLAHTLRIIFPGDMEKKESVMESVFAAMWTATTDKKIKDPKDELQRALNLRAEDLKTKLREDVAQGWYFARNLGHETIERDSVDYGEFIERFEQEGRRAATRIEAWRRYIGTYLEFHNAAVLVILLDDSDVRPELTEDILHSIRMFFNHPRVVTVLAGNLKSMRSSLLHLSMRRIGQSMAALHESDNPTAKDWRRIERQEIEEYLEKVIPPAQRIFVHKPALYVRRPVATKVSGDGSDQGARASRSDFEKLTGGYSMRDICVDMLRQASPRFLEMKFDLAIQHELGRRDAPQSRRGLEDFLSWWVYWNRYVPALYPPSARQATTFREYYAPVGARPGNSSKGAGMPRAISPLSKRLVVMLFDSPANYTLIQRLSDDDENLPVWLRKQELSSTWVGRRAVRINRRDLYHGTYTYDYLRYRLDVGLAIPIRDNEEEVAPVEILPRPAGRRYMRHFFRPRNMPQRPRRLGVARWLEHAVVPSNCTYFYDLAALPDVAFIAEPEAHDRDKVVVLQSGAWEAKLADNWLELIGDEQDDLTVKYFTEVICQRLRFTKDVPSVVLMMELDPPDISQKWTGAVFEVFVAQEINSFHGRVGFDSRFWANVAHKLSGKEPPTASNEWPEAEPWAAGAPRMVALYATLVNDLRRAWHAIRIHRLAPNVFESQAEKDDPQDRATWSAVSAARDRMVLYTREKLLEVLKESPWVQGLMKVFREENINNALANLDPKVRSGLNLGKDEVAQIFSATKRRIGEQVQILEEPADFQAWTDRLRALGRLACEGWPVHDLEHDKPFHIERDLFHGGLASLKLEVLRGQTERDKDANAVGVPSANEGAARNLVWLLYGLAPSLSAVIYAHLMGLLYEVELMSGSADPRVGEAGRKPSAREVDAIRTEVANRREKIRCELEGWSEMIGQLSVIMRYVRIKLLHVDAWLFLDRSLAKADPIRPHEAPDERMVFLDRCGFSANVRIDQAKARRIFEALRNAFCAQELSYLAVMPDVSPSTLFGDGWMVDLVTRKGMLARLSKVLNEEFSTDKPEANAGGVFGETEQWLWATNRFLRKFAEELKRRETPPPSSQKPSNGSSSPRRRGAAR